MSKIRQIKIWYRNIPLLKHGIISRYYQKICAKSKYRLLSRHRKLDML